MGQSRKTVYVAVALVSAFGLGGCSVVARGAENGSGGGGATAMPDVASLSTTSEVECGFDTAGLANTPTCYEVSVPEDWANPDPDDRVVLQVAVFAATDEANSVDDPLIYLDGGPGGKTLDTLTYSEDLLVEPYLAERDVIVFDQRGVGLSTPSIDCDETAELGLQDLQGEVPADQAAEKWRAAYAACYERLAADGVNFSAYNSVASANDVEAIRVGLGYEQLNVLGISYGTRLGQTLMRMYPSSLRAVVLDSVVPVAADLQELIEVSGERSLRLVFEACAADDACSETYPTFEDDYFALLDRLDEDPAEIEVNDLNGNSYTAVVDGDDLVGLTFGALYDKAMFASLPQLVARANEGDYGSIGTLATIELINSHFISDGMHYTVECNEEVSFGSPEDLAANLPTEAPWDRLAALEEPLTYFDVCAEWDAGSAPAIENEPVTSDIPTLLLTGTFDPITPPSYAQQVADHLSDSYLIEFPTEGHGVAPSECGAELVLEFLDDPTAAPDASCVDEVDPPTWVIGQADADEVEMVPFEETSPTKYSGLRPDGWDQQGAGTFVRQLTLEDQTAIVMLPTNGVGSDILIPSLEDSFDVEFSEVDATDIEGESWTTFDADDGSVTYRVLFDPDSEFTIIFAAQNEEFDGVFAAVVPLAAASLKLG